MKNSLRLLRSLSPLVFAATSFAQTGPVFTPGNIVVTRSVYTGDATTVTPGQTLPPVCPSTASCGTAKATDNGAYPSPGSSNNVFNNNKVDGSFGVTSPIFIDQLTYTGTLLNTYAVPPNMLVSSFSSKSELAINLSPDLPFLTFVGYVAPPNALDVSNSNTPGVYDPTNPVGNSYCRAVAQLSPNGTLQLTPTNAYSGNNGRAAILAGGLYYMAGNDNNGAGTPANIINATGVEMAIPGQSSVTPPTMVGSFSVTQYTNPATGAPFAADKAGKDNNFRGLTIFNKTLYVTKGSGGNGFDTVYQVGTAGQLPTLATAATTPITVLPGFPTVSAKTAGINSIYPFGIWFANSTTLYVADEGDGVLADAPNSTLAGLQKWTLVNGTWQMAYVLQNGLNLGVPYSVPGYPTALNPATAGLRNITGRVNGDGTATIWAVTATVSANGDQGADPNLLVSITDTLSNTAPASGEQFTVIKAAKAGEVLRGVSLTPTGSYPFQNSPLIVSAATPSIAPLAPGGLASANGLNLAPGYPGPILGVLPDVFDTTSVSITDGSGKTTVAPLFYVSPTEVDFEVPSSVVPGVATVTVTSAGGAQTASAVAIQPVSPAMFTLNNSGLASAYAIRVSANGTQTVENVYTQNTSNGLITPSPISLGAASDKTYLVLYGTGFDAATVASTTVTINGVNAPVVFAGSPGTSAGLDQVNVQIPASLAGKGNVNVQVTVAGVAANPVQITIQ